MYNVAFRYTEKTAGYHGIITWSSFVDKAVFDVWYTPKIKARMEVVEEGISDERAVELTRSTPLECRIASSVQEARNEDGTINSTILDMNLQSTILAHLLDL